jgi:hypothetical protein
VWIIRKKYFKMKLTRLNGWQDIRGRKLLLGLQILDKMLVLTKSKQNEERDNRWGISEKVIILEKADDLSSW